MYEELTSASLYPNAVFAAQASGGLGFLVFEVSR